MEDKNKVVKVSDWSQPIKISLMVLFMVGAAWFALSLLNAVKEIKPIQSLGALDNVDLRVATSSVNNGTATCGTSSSIAIAPLSGRNWGRITNRSTSTVFIGLNAQNTSTEALTAGTGIQLDPVGLVGSMQTTSSFSGKNYFDLGESGINWVGAFSCVANASGSPISFTHTN